MATFQFISDYQGEKDYRFWWNRTEHRAERRKQVLRLLTIETEAEALHLAHLFNDEMETANLRGRDDILAKYDEDMLRAVWKPWEPVTAVMFVLGGKVVERSVNDGI